MNVTRQDALDFLDMAARNWPEMLPLSEDDIGDVATALLAFAISRAKPGWQSMDTAPKDKTAVIIAVPNRDMTGFIVGEAYFDPENYGDGDWWWAGTHHTDYHSGPISELNHHAPAFWQPLPAAPDIATINASGDQP